MGAVWVSATDPALPFLTADRRALKQIFLNLLSNAIKFTPAGGSVTAFARRLADGPICFGVTDTGVGIALEDQGKVFEKFGQGRHDFAPKERGTGLGLSVVRVQLHTGAERDEVLGTGHGRVVLVGGVVPPLPPPGLPVETTVPCVDREFRACAEAALEVEQAGKRSGDRVQRRAADAAQVPVVFDEPENRGLIRHGVVHVVDLRVGRDHQQRQPRAISAAALIRGIR